MVLLRDAGSLCGRRSETLEDRAGCRPRDVFRHRHPFKQRQKPRRDLAAREDTCFRHDRQIPNGTGSQVVRERLQRRPVTAGGYRSDVATSPVSHSKFANPCGALCCERRNRQRPPSRAQPRHLRAGCGLIAVTDVTFTPAKRRKALWEALCLSCGTSLERIAPESLTRRLSEFVHGDMSWPVLGVPPHLVNGIGSAFATRRQFVNSSIAGRNPRLSDGAANFPAPRHCVRAVALAGCGTETNCVACMTPSPSGVGTETR
jgi:hypothetical protein